jgi:hypothetical protein
MAEEFNVGQLVIPGTYIRVRAEALIAAGGVPTGNIGIVGTAAKGADKGTQTLSEYAPAVELFDPYDALATKKHNLVRALEVLYRNGATTVYARAVAAGADTAAFAAAFAELIKDNVQILVAPELATKDALEMLKPLVENGESQGKDMMAVVGSDAADDAKTADMLKAIAAGPRIIFTAPGIKARDAAAGGKEVSLPGTYAAAAVASLLSTLSPQSSLTNKTLPGVGDLTRRFSYGEAKDLVDGGVLVLEKREGIRVVRGVTTDKGAFKQITTRRIVDFAKAGIRRAGDPFIGRLNNQRVRKALQGAINGFLTGMVQDEALISYALQVTATRDDEIGGRAVVNAILQPTFSIDFIAVTLVLQ